MCSIYAAMYLPIYAYNNCVKFKIKNETQAQKNKTY